MKEYGRGKIKESRSDRWRAVRCMYLPYRWNKYGKIRRGNLDFDKGETVKLRNFRITLASEKGRYLLLSNSDANLSLVMEYVNSEIEL